MAFSFNLNVAFTGICSLILDKEVDSPGGMSVVIPDSWDTKRNSDYKSIDDKAPLVRHGSMIQLPSSNVVGLQRSGGGSVLWYPKRHRVMFNFDEGEGARNAFAIDRSVIKHVPYMREIAGKFPTVSKELVGDNPPKEILANILFPQKLGKLSAIPGASRWIFSGKLSTSGDELIIAHMAYWVVLRLENLLKATIDAAPFRELKNPRPGNPGSVERATFELEGRAQNEEVRIVVANLCDTNPLGWGDDDSVDSKHDFDFKWHYECLYSRKDDVRQKLGGEDLPYPVRGPELAGRGRNCFPALWVLEP